MWLLPVVVLLAVGWTLCDCVDWLWEWEGKERRKTQ